MLLRAAAHDSVGADGAGVVVSGLRGYDDAGNDLARLNGTYRKATDSPKQDDGCSRPWRQEGGGEGTIECFLTRPNPSTCSRTPTPFPKRAHPH